MVNSEKKRVVLRSKSKGRSADREVETLLSEYEDSRIPGTNITVSVAVATFDLKHEDRHTVLRLSDDENFRACQKKLKCEPRLAAFVGVFDGHDGDLASDYCSKGLATHVLAELTMGQSDGGGGLVGQAKRWSFAADKAMAPLDFDTVPEELIDKKGETVSDMQIQYIAAFQKAQSRFQNNMEPPSFEEICKPGTLRVAEKTSYNPMQWMTSTPSQPQRGGTTACTISVFAELGEDTPTIVVANTGDSRLITDDGKGNGNYRQVTTEHRPNNPAEKRRLRECVARGECNLHSPRESADIIRVFPGGLAVSRTIGDCTSSRSVICTPEVLNVPLKMSSGDKNGQPEERTQRFVLASDGLWDTLDNETVGKAASRTSSVKRTGSKGGGGGDSPRTPSTSNGTKASKTCTPKEAAKKILQQCLECPGGRSDDITICVVDVGYLS